MGKKKKQVGSVFTDSINEKLDAMPDSDEYTKPYKPVKEKHIDFVDLVGDKAYYAGVDDIADKKSSNKGGGVLLVGLFALLLCFGVFVYFMGSTLMSN